MLVYFFFFFAKGIFAAILSMYLAGNGKSSSEISFIVSSAGLFTMFLQPLMGAIYDRLQRDSLVSVMLLALAGVSGVAFAFTQSNLALFMLNGFALAFLNCVHPVCERMATQSRFPYGKIRAWGAVGYAIAAQISALVYERVSPAFNFVLFGAATVLTAVGFLCMGHGAREKSGVLAAASPTAPRFLFRALWKNRPFRLFALISFLFAGVTGASSTYLPLLLRNTLQSVTATGAILFFAILMELPIILFSNRFMDQLSNRTLLSLNFGLLIVQYLCYGLCAAPWMICALTVLLKSTSTMLYIMVTLKVVLNLVDDEGSATALSLIATVKMAGEVAITFFAGFLSDAFGLRSLFVMLLVFSVVGFAIALGATLPSREMSIFKGDGSAAKDGRL